MTARRHAAPTRGPGMGHVTYFQPESRPAGNCPLCLVGLLTVTPRGTTRCDRCLRRFCSRCYEILYLHESMRKNGADQWEHLGCAATRS